MNYKVSDSGYSMKIEAASPKEAAEKFANEGDPSEMEADDILVEWNGEEKVFRASPTEEGWEIA